MLIAGLPRLQQVLELQVIEFLHQIRLPVELQRPSGDHPELKLKLKQFSVFTSMIEGDEAKLLLFME